MSWLSSIAKGAGKVLKKVAPVALGASNPILGAVLGAVTGNKGSTGESASTGASLANAALGLGQAYLSKRAGDAAEGKLKAAGSDLGIAGRYAADLYPTVTNAQKEYGTNDAALSGVRADVATMLSGGTPKSAPLASLLAAPNPADVGARVRSAYGVMGDSNVLGQEATGRQQVMTNLAGRGLEGSSLAPAYQEAVTNDIARRRTESEAQATLAGLQAEVQAREEQRNGVSNAINFLTGESTSLTGVMDPTRLIGSTQQGAQIQAGLAGDYLGASPSPAAFQGLGALQAYRTAAGDTTTQTPKPQAVLTGSLLTENGGGSTGAPVFGIDPVTKKYKMIRTPSIVPGAGSGGGSAWAL